MIKTLTTIGSLVTIGFGAWHFFVPTVWNWYAYIDPAATELNLPVYFFEGIYDYTCSYEEAKLYFQQLKAPVKGFYTFQESAHSPMFEEPATVLRILRADVLAGLTNLADIK